MHESGWFWRFLNDFGGIRSNLEDSERLCTIWSILEVFGWIWRFYRGFWMILDVYRGFWIIWAVIGWIRRILLESGWFWRFLGESGGFRMILNDSGGFCRFARKQSSGQVWENGDCFAIIWKGTNSREMQKL